MTEPYYQDDKVVLYHGDCLEVTEWLKADVLVTDPPYGMTLRSSRSGAYGDCAIAGDETPEVRDAALAAWGHRPALVFGRWSVPHPPATRMVLTTSGLMWPMPLSRRSDSQRSGVPADELAGPCVTA